MSLSHFSTAQVTRKLEEQFGHLGITHIAPMIGRGPTGSRDFSCLDNGDPSMLYVHDDGFVIIKLLTSKFSDILGQLK